MVGDRKDGVTHVETLVSFSAAHRAYVINVIFHCDSIAIFRQDKIRSIPPKYF